MSALLPNQALKIELAIHHNNLIRSVSPQEIHLTKQRNIDELLRILEIDKKSVLSKYCKNLSIHGNDFADLISWADERNPIYRHKIYYREIVPDDLQPLLNSLPNVQYDKINALQQSNLLRKLAQVVKVRRQLVGHMFHNRDVTLWHFFYFDQRDTLENGNHWEHGSHVHFINYLWPNRDAVYILKEFLEEKPFIRGSLHIRFSDK